MVSIRIVGAGRAGRSFERAFREVGQPAFELRGLLHHDDDLRGAAAGVDALLLAVPDRAVAEVAARVDRAETVVLHCSGSLGLDVLAPHALRASVHPLVTLPDDVIGALRLRGRPYFAVAGDQVATDIALGLGGQPIVVPDEDRPAYHAAACVAANHLVALIGQVERIAETVGLPLEAFVPLARGALEDAAHLGPATALTGPARRGDVTTLERHRRALARDEVPAYEAGLALISRLLPETAAALAK